VARILVIEDDVEMSGEIVACLATTDFDPEPCFDGRKGLEMAVVEPFDAITLDRLLPSLDGLQLVKSLR
jgi:two-component system OmpR family response regulator